jgi:hypothetical protein
MCDADKGCTAWTKMCSVGMRVCCVEKEDAQSGQEVYDVDKGARHEQDAQCGQGVRGMEKRGCTI